MVDNVVFLKRGVPLGDSYISSFYWDGPIFLYYLNCM